MHKTRKITIMLLAIVLMIGMFGINTFASETGRIGNPEITRFDIKKTIHIDKNVENMPSFRFTYNVEQITSLQEMMQIMELSVALDIREDLKNLLNLAAFIRTEEEYQVDLATVVAEFENGKNFGRSKFESVKDDGGNDTNLYSYSSSWPLIGPNGVSEMKPEDFEEVGFYVYKVTENPVVLTSSSSEKWNVRQTPEDELICSQAEYILIIPVGWKNATTKEFIYSDSIILKTKNDDGTKADVKVAVPEFVNVYQRNDSDEFGLEISKQIKGEYADPTKEFVFTIDIARNATESADVIGYTYAIYNRTYEKDKDGVLTGAYMDSKITGTEKTVFFDPGGGVSQTFKLKHNQVLKFDKFPVGTTYTFTENTGGYSPEALVTEGESTTTINGTTGHVANGILKGAKGQDRNEAFVIKQGQDKVEVINTYEISPITGIVTDNLSFILLIIVAAVGMAGYTKMRKSFKY